MKRKDERDWVSACMSVAGGIGRKEVEKLGRSGRSA